MLTFTPTGVSRRFDAGSSFATLTAASGPTRTAFTDVVVAVNGALIQRPSLATRNWYGQGWMLIARPDDPAALAALPEIGAIASDYEAWMAAKVSTTDSGGHAHVDVLKAFGMQPEGASASARIAREVETPYSGICQGCHSGSGGALHSR